MTSRGYLTDLIESIGEDIALTSHIEESLRASDDEEEINNLKTILEATLTLRRQKMARLLSLGENGNPLKWCAFKHSLGGFVRATEVYEATHSEEDFEIMKNSANLLAMNTSLFLGMEFETCARCLADSMLTKQLSNESV